MVQIPPDNSNLDDKNEPMEKKPKNKWKYVIFFAIWLFSAWHLLTVKENILIKHDILLDVEHTKSASLQELSVKNDANNLSILIVYFVILQP